MVNLAKVYIWVWPALAKQYNIPPEITAEIDKTLLYRNY